MSRQRFAPADPCAIEPRAFGIYFDSPCTPANVIREGIAVVSIRGALMHHEGWFDSYDAIEQRVQAALKERPRAIVLSIDSPGGLVSGCFDTAAELRKLCADANVALYAYVDGQATSAAYALACAASRIGIPSTGQCGSIGVIQEVTDARAQAAMYGVQVKVLTSGARKADGHPMVELTDGAVGALQKRVDDQARVFFAHVAEARGMAVEAVAALEAGIVMGDAAVAAGLADDCCTLDEMLTAIGSGTFGAAVAAGVSIMGASKDIEAGIAALRKAADSDDEAVAAKAKRMLKAELADDDAPPAKEPDKKDDAPADKKDAKADDAPADKKDKEPDGDEAKAIALEVRADVKALRAEQAAQAIATERANLLASRPDMEPELRASLAKPTTAIETVRDVVKSLPKRAIPKPAAAAMATGTRGEGQGDEPTSSLSASEAHDLDVRMGLKPASGGAPRLAGNHLVLPVMTRADARGELAKREREEAAKRAANNGTQS